MQSELFACSKEFMQSELFACSEEFMQSEHLACPDEFVQSELFTRSDDSCNLNSMLLQVMTRELRLYIACSDGSC